MDYSAHECSPLNVNTYRNNNFSVLVKQTKNVARRHDVIVHRSVVNLKLLTVQIRWIFHIPRDPSGAAPPRALESDWTTRGQRLLARGQSLSRPGCLFRVDPPELATVCPVDEADLPTHEEPQTVFKKRKENTCGCSGQRTVQSRQPVPFKRPALRVLTDTRRRRRKSKQYGSAGCCDRSGHELDEVSGEWRGRVDELFRFTQTSEKSLSAFLLSYFKLKNKQIATPSIKKQPCCTWKC